MASAPRDLRAFLDCLRQAGELVQVDAPVDPHLEVAEVHRRVIAAGGPALLFTSVKGAQMPLVTNLFRRSNCPMFSAVFSCRLTFVRID